MAAPNLPPGVTGCEPEITGEATYHDDLASAQLEIAQLKAELSRVTAERNATAAAPADSCRAASNDKWSHHTACHLDGAVMVTAIPDETKCLLTVRWKDHDLTADDCKALAATLREAAVRLRGDDETPALASCLACGADLEMASRRSYYTDGDCVEVSCACGSDLVVYPHVAITFAVSLACTQDMCNGAIIDGACDNCGADAETEGGE